MPMREHDPVVAGAEPRRTACLAMVRCRGDAPAGRAAAIINTDAPGHRLAAKSFGNSESGVARLCPSRRSDLPGHRLAAESFSSSESCTARLCPSHRAIVPGHRLAAKSFRNSESGVARLCPSHHMNKLHR